MTKHDLNSLKGVVNDVFCTAFFNQMLIEMTC